MRAPPLKAPAPSWREVAPERQALPAGVTDTKWTIKSATIATLGSSLVTDLEVDFGIRVATEGSQSETVDRIAFLTEVIPRITLKGIDPTWFSTLGPNGTAVTGVMLA